MSEFLSYLDFLRGLEIGLRAYYQQRTNNLPTSNTDKQLIGALDQITILIKNSLTNNFALPSRETV